jgi:hypothetical protein
MAESKVEELLNDAFANARAKLRRDAIDLQRERKELLDELAAAGDSLSKTMQRAYAHINAPTQQQLKKRKAKRGWRFWKRR